MWMKLDKKFYNVHISSPGLHKPQAPMFYTKDPVRLQDFESFAPVSLPEKQYLAVSYCNYIIILT